MHICHVITRLIIGGAQENTLLTCRGLHEHGHRVTLLAGPETGAEGSLWDQANAIGCSVCTVDAMRRAVRPLADRAALRTLTRLFRELGPNVVHTHSSKAGILGRLAAARAGVPAIVHTIHGMSFNRTQPFLWRVAYHALERRAARYTSAFVTVADTMIDQAVAAGLAPRDRFTTVYSGMETERFAPRPDVRARVRSDWGVSERQVVVGTIARLFENKGYPEIIDVVSRVASRDPNLRFVWIGDGPNRRTYERRLERLGVRDRVHLHGLVPPEAVAEQVNGFDMLLHASRWEGLPRAVVQALLTEVPAVSFDNDGAPEVVRPGETGALVPFGDTAGLAEAVLWLGGDRPLRERLGRGGREYCRERFDWRKMVEALEALYAGMANEE